MSPASFMNPEFRPVKVDCPSDVTGMVDTGNLTAVLKDPADVTAVMESMARLSNSKLGRVQARVTREAVIQDLVRCGYLSAADLADRFADNPIDPAQDKDILGDEGIFSMDDWTGSDGREFQKTAAVMKMVLEGHAGAGTITMGGFDYHTGDRATGERRDLRAGQCMGACLDYARRKGSPLILYVFSDGSVSSNGQIDDSAMGGGKGQWTSDNSSTAASFFLVYHPGRIITPIRSQIGYFRSGGAVETSSSPAANNVNLLVETIMLNYLALHGEQGALDTRLAAYGLSHGLGSTTARDNLLAFAPICTGTIDNLV